MGTNEEAFYQTLLVIGTILGSFLLFFIFTIIRHQRKNLRLHRERLNAQIEILEMERKRIAGDLHDEIGPMLSGIKLNLSTLETKDPNEQKLIAKTQTYLDQSISRMREISSNLMPAILKRSGLKDALNAYLDGITGTNNLQINFHYDNQIAMDKEKEVSFYRMILEIIHNTIKHSHATKLQIELQKKANNLILLSRDNGIGFNLKHVQEHGSGLGLKNISNRIEALGGECRFVVKQGSGLQIIAEVPININS